MTYDLYPAVDDEFNFPPEVREALSKSVELRNTVIPMTSGQRDNLTALEKWNGRLIFNTDLERIQRYDGSPAGWVTTSQEPGDEIITAKTAAELPNTYPMGYSLMQIGNDTSWPNAIGVGMVETRRASSANRLVQTFTSKDNKVWTRTEESGNVWTAWRRLGAGHITTVALTADQSGAVGNINIMQSAVIVSDGLRKWRVNWTAMYGVAANDTGIMAYMQYRLNGGAWTEVLGSRVWGVKPTTAFTDYLTSEATFTPPAGNIELCLNAQAVGVNGQTINGSGGHTHYDVHDAGPA